MLQFIYGLSALCGFALQNILYKRVMEKCSPVRAIIYRGSMISLILILSSFFLVSSYYVPGSLYPVLAFEVFVGAVAIITFFTALKEGKAGVIGALAQMYVLVVNAVFARIILKEKLDRIKYISVVLLMVGLLVVAMG